MRKRFNKITAIMMAVMVVFSLFPTFPFSVAAAEVETEEVGADVETEKVGASKTQAEAVDWANGKVGSWIGSGQCVALIEAYCSYLGISVSGGNGNACDYTGARNISDSSRITNYNGFVPKPGDICVWGSYAYMNSGYQTNVYGHIGIVISADASNMVTVECNLDAPYNGGICKKVTRNRPTSYVTCFIRPNFISIGHVMSESEGAGRTIPDGDYWIRSEIAQDFFLDIPGNDFNTPNGKNVQTWIWGSGEPPIYDVWHFEYLNNGFYRITQYSTKMCLQVESASLYRGTNVHAWEIHDSLGQQWSVEQTDSGYRLRARCNAFCLDIDCGKHECGTNVLIWEDTGDVNQRFSFVPYIPKGHVMTQAEGAGQTIPDGDYWICSRIAQNYFLDIAGNNYNTVSGENLKTWIWDSAKTPGKWDAFHFKYLNNGYYQITQYNTNMAIDVDGASLYRGTNVQMWEKNSSNAQQWSIEITDKGYKFRSKANNYYLDVNGARHENDTNIQVWTSNDSDAQFFGLIPYAPDERPIKDGIYTIKSQVSDTCYLDADGISGTFVNGSNIQLWNCSDGDEQFKIEYEGNGYYRIYEVSTNLPLEIINLPNEYLNDFENAMLYEKTESRGQLWKIKKNSDGTYFFISQLNGYYLDVYYGLTANGTNVNAHTYNGANAQRWKPRRILSDDMVTVKNVVTNSDETSVSPSVTVKVDNSAINSRFYTVKTTTDIPNGTGTVTVTGKDDFCGSVTKSFKITINDTTVINDWLQNHYNTEKDDIITYYMKLNPPFPVNHLSGTFYFSEDVLEPIFTPYSHYHAPSFDHADFHRMGGGQIRFDLYASQPVTLNNDIVVRMQFRVIKKGGESWLGNDFDDAQFSWDNLIQYGMEPHILTNQKLFVLGDTNGDGTVNICDVTALQRHLADLTTLNDSELAAADANGDGVVDINDATYLQMYLAEYNVALGKQS